jgi:hypothetical protein
MARAGSSDAARNFSNVAHLPDNGSGGQQKWFIDYGYGHPGAFEIHLNGNSFAFLGSNPVTVPSGWNAFELVKSGDLYSFYLNGVGIGSDTFSGVFPTPTAPLTFGLAEPGVPQFTGLLERCCALSRRVQPRSRPDHRCGTARSRLGDRGAADVVPTPKSRLSWQTPAQSAHCRKAS